MKTTKSMTVLQLSKYSRRFIRLVTTFMIIMFITDIIKTNGGKLSEYILIIIMIVLAKFTIFYINEIEKEYRKYL